MIQYRARDGDSLIIVEFVNNFPREAAESDLKTISVILFALLALSAPTLSAASDSILKFCVM